MLAIHNKLPATFIVFSAANAFAKLSKCQQFTTNLSVSKIETWLQTLLQSYQNVSNSQHDRGLGSRNASCKRFCKVIKMLAIHNVLAKAKAICFAANAFAKLSKCQQFTTAVYPVNFYLQLQTLLQSYQNVSNSQPVAL